jgi:hypothetical protein
MNTHFEFLEPKILEAMKQDLPVDQFQGNLRENIVLTPIVNRKIERKHFNDPTNQLKLTKQSLGHFLPIHFIPKLAGKG